MSGPNYFAHIRAGIHAAQSKFREYEAMHTRKGTVEGRIKAESNADEAEKLDTTLGMVKHAERLYDDLLKENDRLRKSFWTKLDYVPGIIGLLVLWASTHADSYALLGYGSGLIFCTLCFWARHMARNR